MNGRDGGGRFVAGNPGGPGRPARQTEREYLRALAGACSLDDWREIVQRASADAKSGDTSARNWLSRYLLGENPPTLRQLAVEEITGCDPLQPAVDDARLMQALTGRPRSRSAD